MKNIHKLFRATFPILISTMVCFGFLEGAARVWYYFRTPRPIVVDVQNMGMGTRNGNERYNSEDYDAVGADGKYCGEFMRAPFVYWKRKACSTSTINIDSRGIRKTVQPFSESAPLQIYLLGGSLAFGSGVRDGNTIASVLAQELEKKGYQDFHITNLGQSAYMSMQEVLTLLMEIKAARVPQIAIFLDGSCEAISTVLNGGTPGMTQKEGDLVFRWAKDEVKVPVAEKLAQKAFLVRALINIRAKLRPKTAAVQAASELTGPTTEVLAERTYDDYQATSRLADKLAAAYGIETYFFWGATVFSAQKTLSPVEKEIAEEISDWDLWNTAIETTKHIDRRVAKRPFQLSRFHNLSGVFQGYTDTIFFDPLHPNERGTRLIGAAMAQVMAKQSRVLPTYRLSKLPRTSSRVP